MPRGAKLQVGSGRGDISGNARRGHHYECKLRLRIHISLQHFAFQRNDGAEAAGDKIGRAGKFNLQRRKRQAVNLHWPAGGDFDRAQGLETEVNLAIANFVFAGKSCRHGAPFRISAHAAQLTPAVTRQ